jgi:hypothetical protein
VYILKKVVIYRMEYIGRIGREEEGPYRRVWGRDRMQRGTGGKGEKESHVKPTGFEGEKRAKRPAGPKKKEHPKKTSGDDEKEAYRGKRGAKRYSRFRVPTTR